MPPEGENHENERRLREFEKNRKKSCPPRPPILKSDLTPNGIWPSGWPFREISKGAGENHLILAEIAGKDHFLKWLKRIE
jgi:hypothetical protein